MVEENEESQDEDAGNDDTKPDDEEVSELENEKILNEISDEVEDDADDFSIGDAILLTESASDNEVKNLEESISGENIERGWEEDNTFGRNIYSPNSDEGNHYADNQSMNPYQDTNATDLYAVSHEGEMYSMGNKSQDSNGYVTQMHTSGYGEVENSRRSSKRSMLEIAGFEDKEKQKTRDMRAQVRYDATN